MQHQGGNWVATLLPFVILATVLALRLRSMSRERPLKLATLWIVPAVYVVIAGSMLISLAPPALGWGLLLAGLGVGIAVGWHRGKLIRIERNSDTGELRQKASPVAMLLLIAIIIVRFGARAIFGEAAAGHASSSAMLLTDALLGFAFGLLSATRLEIYLRARRLLESA